ncbi:MAG: hypothetical protein QM817_22320 [Archangium sp.]
MRWTVTLVFLASVAAAQDFNRLETNGRCAFWNTRSLTFYVDAVGNPETTGNTEFVAIERALAAWVSATSGCSDLVLTYGGTVTAPRREFVLGGPNRNVIIFRQEHCVRGGNVPMNDPCWLDDSCGNAYSCWNYPTSVVAMPTITTSQTTGEVLDVDIELNAPSFLFTTVDSPACVSPNFSQACVATDVQNTITPMIGRAIGLTSVSVPSSTMFPSAAPGEISKRMIDPGTVAGFCAIYPRGAPPTSCDGGVAIRVDAGTGGGGGATGGGGGATGGGGGTTGGGGGATGGGSSAPPPCSALTCAGCCTFDGRCELGTSDIACGAGGLSCASCNGSDSCQMGTCQLDKRGCGCTSIEGVLAVAALALALKRRDATRRDR